MSTTDSLFQNPASSGLQMALLLQRLLQSSSDESKAGASLDAANADQSALYRGMSGDTELLRALQQALLGQVAPIDASGEISEEEISNREAQRFSRLAPSVDRAQALVASQDFAKALRTGMSDSTALEQVQNNRVREFSDVYAKLQENARTTAFNEALERLKGLIATQGSGGNIIASSAQGMANYANRMSEMNNARGNAAAGAKRSSSAAVQDTLARVLDSAFGKRLVGYADKKLGEFMGDDEQYGGYGSGAYMSGFSDKDLTTYSNRRQSEDRQVAASDFSDWTLGGGSSSEPPEPAEQPSYGYDWSAQESLGSDWAEWTPPEDDYGFN